MLSAVDRIIEALEERDLKVTQHKTDDEKWQAQCPGHDDKTPSLSIRAYEEGALLHCHAGCDVSDVLAELGMTKRDLFDDPEGTNYPYDDGRVVRRRVAKDGSKEFPQFIPTPG